MMCLVTPLPAFQAERPLQSSTWLTVVTVHHPTSGSISIPQHKTTPPHSQQLSHATVRSFHKCFQTPGASGAGPIDHPVVTPKVASLGVRGSHLGQNLAAFGDLTPMPRDVQSSKEAGDATCEIWERDY